MSMLSKLIMFKKYMNKRVPSTRDNNHWFHVRIGRLRNELLVRILLFQLVKGYT